MIEYGLAGERGHRMEERKRRRLTARRKFEIYLETKKEGAKIGEILRREAGRGKAEFDRAQFRDRVHSIDNRCGINLNCGSNGDSV